MKKFNNGITVSGTVIFEVEDVGGFLLPMAMSKAVKALHEFGESFNCRCKTGNPNPYDFGSTYTWRKPKSVVKKHKIRKKRRKK